MVETRSAANTGHGNSPERAASSNPLGLLLQSRKTFVVTSCFGLALGGVLAEKGLTSANLSNLSSSNRNRIVVIFIEEALPRSLRKCSEPRFFMEPKIYAS